MNTTTKFRCISLLTAGIAALLAGCCCLTERQKAKMPASPNTKLLDEANRSQVWFHARKTRPIWAKKLDQEQNVDTLEGKVVASAGDFLCRGEAGEVWPQKRKDLETKYTATDKVDDKGWRQYEPRVDAEGIMAAQIKHPFQVQASWGRLSGKAGDYLAKNFRDRDIPYPDDVWVVDQNLFRATYEAVKP